ncbi:MAG TPA: DUF502 domain-containing protein [Sedimentisphaerales bacterium]|nr:DUF502 domain-containing protein [Sedimentisphaerales bacterium]
MKKLATYFIKGLLVCVPLVVTVTIAIWVFRLLYSFVAPFVGVDQPPFWMKAALTAGVLLLMLTVIVLAGFTASNYFGQKLFKWVESKLEKLPVFKMIYTSVKDITQAFAGEKKKFDRPVLVRVGKEGPMAVGFITADSLDFAGVADRIAVYMPQSYNFAAGQMIIVPREWIQHIKLDSKEAMTLVVSGGIVKSGKEG